MQTDWADQDSGIAEGRKSCYELDVKSIKGKGDLACWRRT